jgi:hypothetical protein
VSGTSRARLAAEDGLDLRIRVRAHQRLVLALIAFAQPHEVARIDQHPQHAVARLPRASAADAGGWVARLLAATGLGEGQRMRVGVQQFLRVTDRITVDVSFGHTAAATVERKLRSVVGAIPGAKS